MAEFEDVMNSLTLELRRGTIVLSALSQLENPKYGYALVQSLQEKGVLIDAGTLYPLLRRLEKQNILKSEWETTGTKPRKYYVRTNFGSQVYAELCSQWKSMTASMNLLMNEGEMSNGNS